MFTVLVCRECGASYALDFQPSLGDCHGDDAWDFREVRDWRSYWTVQQVEFIPEPEPDEPTPEISSLGMLPDPSMLVEGGLIEPMTHECGRDMTIGSLTLNAERMRLWFHCAICNETEPILDTIRNPLVVL